MVPALPLPGTRRREPLRAPGRDADLHGFGAGDAAVAAAGGAGVAQLAGAAAARAGEVELHGAGHLGDVAGAFALRAGDFAGAGGAGAVAGVADFVAGDVEARLGAPDGLPEIDIHHVFEVAALFGLGLRRAAPRPPKNCEKMSRKPPASAPRSRGARRGCRAAGPARCEEIRKIEAAEIHVRAGGPAGTRPPGRRAGKAVLGIEAVLVVHLALLRVAQDVVGFLDVLEALLGGLVPGVQVGMILARELPVGLADLVRGGLARNAQRFVIVVLGSRHSNQTGIRAGARRLRQPGPGPTAVYCHLLLLVVDIHELGVDDVVFVLLALVAAGRAAVGRRARRRRPAPGWDGGFVHGFGQFVAGGGQPVDGGVDARRDRSRPWPSWSLRGPLRSPWLRRRRSWRGAPSASSRRCRPWRRRGCGLRWCRAACGRRRRAIRRPWPSSPLRPWTGRKRR